MNLVEKHKAQVQIQKERRKEEVVEAALEVFKEKGIENAKMTDVAKAAEVGIASVYRYFKTKPDLVIEAATCIWQQEIQELLKQYISEDFTKQRGIDQVQQILEVFLYLYKNHPHFLKFIHEFDSYIVKEDIPRERLLDYETSIVDLKKVMVSALEQGVKDGSIRQPVSTDEFYNTITHTLMSLCQKLLLRGTILKSDTDVEGIRQLELVIEMAVKYLSYQA